MPRPAYWLLSVSLICLFVLYVHEMWATASNLATPHSFALAAQVEAHELDGSHPHFDHHDPRFSADLTFPPQPANIEQVTALASEQRRSFTVPMPDLAQLPLGEQFVRVGSQTLQDKDSADSSHTLSTFYSYTHDTTLLVQHHAETIITTTVLAADQYQPPLLTVEVAAAIEVAREGLAQQHADLVGFAILALPPDGQTPYFPTRVAYVTFHEHVDLVPLWTAYVDLSQMQIINITEG